MHAYKHVIKHKI